VAVDPEVSDRQSDVTSFWSVATVQRILVEGTRRGSRALQSLADEYRERRIALGLSQEQVGSAVGISGSSYSRIESGLSPGLSVVRACQIGRVLGLDISVRAYPGPAPLRDGPQWHRLLRVLDVVGPPLSYGTEVPLPQRPEAPTEQRAWDAMISGGGLRTGVEMEMRVRDAQALERRTQLKMRDDPVDRLLLLLADTRTDREMLRTGWSPLGLPRLTIGFVCRLLTAGRHPPSGTVLV
jgi:transcriptional regulator with XRE-family HTH domain